MGLIIGSNNPLIVSRVATHDGPIEISSLSDTTGASAGDIGIYTNPASGAVETYRLRSVTIDAAIGGGTLLTWVPAALYGEAGLTIRGRLVGTETMPARGSAIGGYTVGGGGDGSVASSGGEIAIASTGAGGFANLLSTYAIQPTDRYYIRCNMRLEQVAGQNVTFYFLTYDNGTGQAQFITTQNPVLNSGKWVSSNTVGTFFGSGFSFRGGTLALTNTAELVEVTADGPGSDLVTVRRNSEIYFSLMRNAQTGTATGQHLMQTFQTTTSAQTFRLSNLLFMTY